MTGLAAALPVRDLLTLDAPTDAALLWALVRHRLRRGDDPAAVLAETVLTVDAAAPGSRLNLLLTDGTADVGHHLDARALGARRAGRRDGRVRADGHRAGVDGGAGPAPRRRRARPLRRRPARCAAA